MSKTQPTRRGFVRLAAGALAAGAGGPAMAGSGAEWRDAFDTGSGGAADVRTSTPILSPLIVQKLQGAIAQYTEIVSRGGWPVSPRGPRCG